MNDLRIQSTEDRGQRTENKSRASRLTPHTSRLTPRRGVTLIELLVVISIMMLLAAYALPKLGPMAKERKIREASRSVNVFLSRARSRAIETGRPCGVVFHRVSNDVNNPLSKAVSMLYQAEVPPPYAGDTLDARVRMTGGGTTFLATVEPGSMIQPNLLRIGDLMQINGQGPWYTIDSRNPDLVDLKGNPNPDGIIDGVTITQLFLSVDRQYQGSLPWIAAPSAALPFKILRRPARTIAQPLTLPVGTTVDLAASGTDEKDSDGAQFFFSGREDVMIMFSPNGSAGLAYYDCYEITNMNPLTYGFVRHSEEAVKPIYLLVGWRDQIDIPSNTDVEAVQIDPDKPEELDEETVPNWQNLSNFWITLSPQTGLISTSEIFYPQDLYRNYTKNGFPTDWKFNAINASRQYARQASSKGGR